MGTKSKPAEDLVVGFGDLTLDDVDRVGGKNASLGEMYRELSGAGIRVPPGFATTTRAYQMFLEASGLRSFIDEKLASLDAENIPELREVGESIREAIREASFPDRLADAIVDAYRGLSGQEEPTLDVAVRSSATAEDLPEASFAGQHESFLNVRGPETVLEACQHCIASLFTDRAISYRADTDFSATDVALSVGIQQMVRSDLGASGVAFSVDTETGFEDAVFLTASWGLGDAIVAGKVNPDEYYVFKPTLGDAPRPILQKNLGDKALKVVYDGRETKTVEVATDDRERFTLEDDQILEIAEWVCLIEDHYGERQGRATPVDVEWALDGETGELFIVQARPETVQAQQRSGALEMYELQETGPVLVEGRGVGDAVAVDDVQVLDSADDIESFEAGNILVTDTTDPDWEPVMQRAGGIVTNRGGRTSHAAIVSRELGLPAVVGAGDATERLETGRTVTVSCAEGEVGRVYDGELAYETEAVDIEGLERPETDIMMNLADPGRAFRHSFIPNDGVGLARQEFIVNTHIGVHPMALLEPEEVDEEVREEIAERTRGYDDHETFFVEQLSEGVAMIASAFYPEDVIVRLSDFKSNEYASLVGGSAFEPDEENPMLGFRGASRYYDEDYQEAFRLECRALRRVRDAMGLTNVKVMLPFCRTPEEGVRVQEIMAEEGLERGVNDLELYVMCEIPSNVVLAEEFARHFDGFSIGSNDLTQLVLGVDRDSEKLAHLFDERHGAVKETIRNVVERAHAHDCNVGICGQAPSDHPEFARFLVDAGVDSISLTPDTVLETTRDLEQYERNA